MTDVDNLEPDWSRSEWARWWLDHNEPAAAAAVLEAGDVLVVEPSDAPRLEAALARRGLVLLREDGQAFVYTPDEARAVLEEVERDEMLAQGPRRPLRSTVGQSDDSGAAVHVEPAARSRGRR
jgi:hypothetical protein